MLHSTVCLDGANSSSLAFLHEEFPCLVGEVKMDHGVSGAVELLDGDVLVGPVGDDEVSSGEVTRENGDGSGLQLAVAQQTGGKRDGAALAWRPGDSLERCDMRAAHWPLRRVCAGCWA